MFVPFATKLYLYQLAATEFEVAAAAVVVIVVPALSQFVVLSG